jgi:hypothetical protein
MQRYTPQIVSLYKVSKNKNSSIMSALKFLTSIGGRHDSCLFHNKVFRSIPGIALPLKKLSLTHSSKQTILIELFDFSSKAALKQ